MAVLPQEVFDFVAQQAPFNTLQSHACEYFCNHLEVIYVTQQNQHQWLDSNNPQLFLVRSGLIDLVCANDETIARLGEGDYFGYPSLLTGEAITNRIDVKQPALVYVLNQQDFDHLRYQYKPFEQYFVKAHSNRLLSTKYQQLEDSWCEQKVGSLMTRQAVTLAPNTSITECAKTMSEQRVSSVMVTENERLVGVVTDRDLRTRVLAQGLPVSEPISKIMSVKPRYIFEHNRIFSAMHLMLKYNIHHLPVLDEHYTPLGMITSTDLLRQQKSDPVQLIGRIYKANTLAELKQYAAEVPELLNGFAHHIDDISLIGQLLSGITDALTISLINLFQKQHGDAPARFSWICFGSQAREEQTLHSDQDNGLVLSDNLTPEQNQYFKDMAEYVCTQLDVCGIRRCPGNIMASNERCRLSVRQWQQRFDKWLDSPTPEALLNCKIFFDIRFVHGSNDLYSQFRNGIENMPRTELFLRAMAAELASSSVPIGLFNQLKTQTNEQQQRTIDLKKHGLMIINDIVRLYALQAGSLQANTLERLEALTKTQWLSKKDIFDLKDCWRYLTQLRLRAQLTQPDIAHNCVNPDALSSLEKHQLKEAFYLVRQAKQAANFKFSRTSL